MAAGAWKRPPDRCILHDNVVQMNNIVMKGCMAANALVQTRIDPVIKERATAVLEDMGLTVSDAVRIMLT